MNKFDGHFEKILQCTKCGTVLPEYKVAVVRIENHYRQYCNVCQNEEFVIISEET